ncbi:MAG: hypothetical protein Q7N50_08805 [Armatimonadota bacterium]|nr:hypothetical protein [Armatimonadota bacterium]
MTRLSIVKTLLLVGIAIIAIAGAPAYGQVEGVNYAQVANQYLVARLGIQDVTGYAQVPGKFSFGYVEGDPETDSDDNTSIIYGHEPTPHGNFGFALLHIQDINFDFVIGDSASGSWVLAPYADPKTRLIRAIWKTNPFGGTVDSSGYIEVEIKISLRRDMGRINYVITNKGSMTHSIGVRMYFDEVAFGDCLTKPVIFGYGYLPGETEFSYNDIPDYIDHLDTIIDPTLVSRHLFRGQDITTPDRVVVADYYSTFSSYVWDYTIPNPVTDVDDTSTAAWWNPVGVGVRGSREITLYFGSAAATGSYTMPFVLAAQAERNLQYDTSSATGLLPDPFTVTAYMYNLHGFDTGILLNNPNFFITLPEGLELASGETISKPSATVYPQEEGAVTWSVRATGEVAGDLEYIVTGGAGGNSKSVKCTVTVPATTTTKFKQDWQMISVPFNLIDPTPAAAFQLLSSEIRLYRWNADARAYETVDSLQLGEAFWLNCDSDFDVALAGASADQGLTAQFIPLRIGWNQIGNPYVHSIPWGKVKFLKEGSLEDPISWEAALQTFLIRPNIFWYDTITEQYMSASKKTAQLTPWRGYWVRALQRCTMIIPPMEEFDLEPIVSSSATTSRVSSVPLEGILGEDFYPEVDLRSSAKSHPNHTYAHGAKLTAVPTLSSEPISAAAPETAGNPIGWGLRLVAKTSRNAVGWATAGASSSASDGYDNQDMETPPPLKNYVAISFPHNDWGINNGKYYEDVRGRDRSRKIWDMQVETDQLNSNVTLTWPDLAAASKEYAFKLVDLDGNKTKSLSATGSYRYNSRNSTVRRLRLIAEPMKAVPLTISRLKVSTSRASRTANISYNLSPDAIVDISVKKRSGGRTVRKLVIAKSAAAGTSVESWDYRDDTGKLVSFGLYFVEVRAATSERSAVKTSAPFLVMRQVGHHK